MNKSIVALYAALSIILLTACSREGSAEKTGESVDSAIENATQGEKSLGDGPVEKAGESVDKSTGQSDKDPIDGIGDAVDGNASTKP
jgi:hypothetical protein